MASRKELRRAKNKTNKQTDTHNSRNRKSGAPPGVLLDTVSPGARMLMIIIIIITIILIISISISNTSNTNTNTTTNTRETEYRIPIIREFRDVVFEDVVFDNNSSVAPY